MTSTRRDVLRLAAGAGVAALLPSASVPAATEPTMPAVKLFGHVTISDGLDDWRLLTGKFRIHTDGDALIFETLRYVDGGEERQHRETRDVRVGELLEELLILMR